MEGAKKVADKLSAKKIFARRRKFEVGRSLLSGTTTDAPFDCISTAFGAQLRTCRRASNTEFATREAQSVTLASYRRPGSNRALYSAGRRARVGSDCKCAARMGCGAVRAARESESVCRRANESESEAVPRSALIAMVIKARPRIIAAGPISVGMG